MKKTIKGLSAILMTSVLAVSASAAAAPVFADDTYTITMSSTANHTYTAYQVFTGDLHETGTAPNITKTLSNITWGTGVDGTALLAALKSSTDNLSYYALFSSCSTAADVADVLDNYATDSAQVKAFAKLAAAHLGTAETGLTGLSAGYYLIKDTTAAASMPAGETYSDFMLKVVSNVSVAAKDETVSSDKNVTDVNDSTGTSDAPGNTADYDIGDDVPYVLTFTLPSKYAEYSKYPITFTDDMCAGLTYNGDAKIYYGDTDTTGTSITLSTADGTEYTGGQKYTYSIADLKASQAAAADGTALKSLAAGSTIRIEYTAKLNAGAVVGGTGNPNKYSVTFANDPTFTGTGTPPTGTTPPDTNTVYTYQLIINKTDGTEPITGAAFVLSKLIKGTGGAEDTWVDVTALHTGSGAVNPTYTVSDGTNSSSETVSDCVFTFSGLDDGTYKLHESVTPGGYNTIDDIVFDITPSADGTLVNVTTPITLTADNTAGSLTGNVVNNEGIQLPGTGGIGTTIFYIIGGLLISGALVLFIVKKRMSIKEK